MNLELSIHSNLTKVLFASGSGIMQGLTFILFISGA